MNVAIIRFLGTNCEWDMHHAYTMLGARTHFVWFTDSTLPKDTNLVVLPGGFSYGDYLRCGAIARFAPIMSAVTEFAKKGGRVLGICNGFQILLESGLLEGALMRNHSGRFVSKIATLCVQSNDNVFLRNLPKGAHLRIPIAHADGCYYTPDVQSLREHDQILLCYEDNPNGSMHNIAGICNKEKNIFGLMPHPERAMESLLGSTDGVALLRNLLC